MMQTSQINLFHCRAISMKHFPSRRSPLCDYLFTKSNPASYVWNFSVQPHKLKNIEKKKAYIAIHIFSSSPTLPYTQLISCTYNHTPTCQRKDRCLRRECAEETGDLTECRSAPVSFVNAVNASVPKVYSCNHQQIHTHQQIAQGQVHEEKRMVLQGRNRNSDKG